MTNYVQIILGIALLLTGRKLFWLFVGAVGFVIGMALASMLVPGDNEILKLVIALVAGILGAVLARAAQGFAIALSGFIVGGYIVSAISEMLKLNLGALDWLLIVAGGILGAILLAILFEWALIILSSFLGAIFLVQIPDFSRSLEIAGVIILFVFGFAIQAGVRHRERSKAAHAK